jgi:hypothetical protein
LPILSLGLGNARGVLAALDNGLEVSAEDIYDHNLGNIDNIHKIHKKNRHYTPKYLEKNPIPWPSQEAQRPPEGGCLHSAPYPPTRGNPQGFS